MASTLVSTWTVLATTQFVLEGCRSKPPRQPRTGQKPTTPNATTRPIHLQLLPRCRQRKPWTRMACTSWLLCQIFTNSFKTSHEQQHYTCIDKIMVVRGNYNDVCFRRFRRARYDPFCCHMTMMVTTPKSRP